MDLTPKYTNGLHGFFYDNAPRPNNLAYICGFLLEREDAVKKIRNRLEDLSAVSYQAQTTLEMRRRVVRR